MSLVIKKTADFLGKSLNDQRIAELEVYLSFAKMKENPSLNYEAVKKVINENKSFGSNFKSEGQFFRKGLADQWKKEMSADMIRIFDDWIAEKLKDHSDLKKEFL